MAWGLKEGARFDAQRWYGGSESRLGAEGQGLRSARGVGEVNTDGHLGGWIGLPIGRE